MELRLHYNYFRTYEPSTGRYLESDPIGLGGRLNTQGNQDNDVRLDDAHIASVFAHEAAHVWQRQNGVAVTRRAIGPQIGDFFGNSPYDYDRSITDPSVLKDVFDNGNVERQGQIIRDSYEETG